MNSETKRGLIRKTLRAGYHLALRQAAKGYVAGETISDARREANKWAERSISCTFGYWDHFDPDGETARDVLEQYLAAVEHMRTGEYLSIKLTALDYSEVLLDELAESAAKKGVRVHFDAMGPETAERTRSVVEHFCARQNGRFPIGYTLPGRWARSVQDAHWAAELGLPVRVVKGQFPENPTEDPVAGFERVVRTLAGRGTHVAVATHNFELAKRSLLSLAETNTSREHELLLGLPVRKNIRLAQSLGVSVRIYIGYGSAYLPYVVGNVADNPRVIWWIARDLFRI